ncbi:hypothetical protein TeGR_g15258 [Tetraparma gracilis]|uniref:Uncharacterized protein n=1 Tax=Tetraparma gracilis TaxID=2962635 RepID=A0ABQ6MMJ1_9STRA|nr:hypothetical protein TeGR_g15258 [Tetraparma gracilis]
MRLQPAALLRLQPAALLLVALLLCACLPKAAALSRPISLTTHSAALACAISELREDLHALGHHHGLALLCASKVARELSVMRATSLELSEDAHLSHSHRFFRLLSSQRLSLVLSTLALAAAFFELLTDLRPGGHHGTLFLAANELLEQLAFAANLSPTLAHSPYVDGALHNPFVVGTLGLGALVAGVAEVVWGARHWKDVGAHHGVVVLGFLHALRGLGIVGERNHHSGKAKHE